MHNGKSLYLVVIGFLLFCLTLSGCGYDLRYGLVKDETLKYKLETDVTTTGMALDGSKINNKQTVQTDITQKVTDVKKEKKTGEPQITMEVEYSNTKITAEANGKPVPTSPVKDTSFEMVINDKGKLVDFTGENVYMEEFIKKFSGMEAVLPNKRVKKGETWENNDSAEIPFPPPTGTLKMKQEVKSTYTFENTEKIGKLNCAKIKIDTTINQKLDPKEAKTLGFEGKGKIEGYFYFGIDKGRVVKTTTDTTMTGTITVMQPKKSPIKRSNEVKSKMTMELVQ